MSVIIINTSPIKTQFTDPIPYGPIHYFVIKTHPDTTKDFLSSKT